MRAAPPAASLTGRDLASEAKAAGGIASGGLCSFNGTGCLVAGWRELATGRNAILLVGLAEPAAWVMPA